MNERQRRVVQAPRYLLYPMLVAGTGAFAWDLIENRTGPTSHLKSLIDRADAAAQPVLILLTGMFWILLGVLIIEFIHREVVDAADYRTVGRPVLTLRRSWITNFLFALPLLSVLVVGINLLLFAPDRLPAGFGSAGLFEWMILWFFYGLIHFLFVVLLVRIVRNRPIFAATDEGFICEPGGDSMGFVRWADVAGMIETDLLVGGESGGMQWRRMMVVTLKDPEHFAARLIKPVRWLQGRSRRFVQWQIDRPGDIVIDPPEMGWRYPDVRKVMTDKIGAAGGTVEIDPPGGRRTSGKGEDR